MTETAEATAKADSPANPARTSSGPPKHPSAGPGKPTGGAPARGDDEDAPVNAHNPNKVASIRRSRQILNKDFKPADFQRNTWAAMVEQGIAVEAILNPEFWTQVAVNPKAGDIIEVRTQDQAYFARLYVTATTKITVDVSLLEHVALGDAVEAIPTESDFDIEWGGPNAKFRVIRKSDGAQIHAGLTNKKVAKKWLHDHLTEAG